MPKSVFYSFHYERDVHRVQLVRNINALEGQRILNPQNWEEVKRRGGRAIEEWIHGEMSYKKAVIVLIGRDTATRPWVIYEIEKAWRDKKPLLGIRVNGISSFGQVDSEGANPFERANVGPGIPLFDPTARDWYGRIDSAQTYRNLAFNLESWSEQGKVRQW
ncbi:TIR domain-containing protein [Dactylosporangium sp. NPDC006015]|uniref:TIR domain-containing protein n=1 Tax=Dactylosporangium sp. NPDC006015 TaxID=3154576 RepID=UPI0033A69C3A